MLSLIVAADRNFAIGNKNNLLCRLKTDMLHFVKTTKNKPIIMGYNTFTSLGFRPLKDRFNIVLTRSPMAMTLEHQNAIEKNENLIFESLEYVQFLIEQSKHDEFVVIGGQQIYELFLPSASKIYFTHIEHSFSDADTYFPALDPADWVITSCIPHQADEFNDYPFTRFTFERKLQQQQ